MLGLGGVLEQKKSKTFCTVDEARTGRDFPFSRKVGKCHMCPAWWEVSGNGCPTCHAS